MPGTLYISNEVNLVAPYHVVATDGDDGGAGTLADPWLTLTYAVTQLMPGDTLYVRGGVYQEDFAIDKIGTAVDPIVITSYPGETAIVDGDNYSFPGVGGFLIHVQGDYISILDIQARYSGYSGILLTGNHNLVHGCTVHHSWYNGIYIGGLEGDVGVGNIVEYCDVFNCSMMNEGDHGTYGTSSGISVAHEDIDGYVHHCHIWNTWGEGLSCFFAENVTFEDNIVHDCVTNVYLQDSDYVLCQRNLVYNDPTSEVTSWIIAHQSTCAPGITLGSELFLQEGQMHNITIINNLCYGNRKNIWKWSSGNPGDGMHDVLIANNTCVNSYEGAGEINLALDTYSNVTIRNNICRLDGAGDVMYLGTNTGITLGYQCFSKAAPANCQGTGDVTDNPDLAETDTYSNPLWYKLLASSPARGAGVVIGAVTEDYWETERSSPPDIGAHEYT